MQGIKCTFLVHLLGCVFHFPVRASAVAVFRHCCTGRRDVRIQNPYTCTTSSELKGHQYSRHGMGVVLWVGLTRDFAGC